VRKTHQDYLLEFAEEILIYREMVINDFYSRLRERENVALQKKILLELFERAPVRIRTRLLPFAFRVISRETQPIHGSSSLNDPEESARFLNAWLEDSAHLLIHELQNGQVVP
jgi:hypothetical protein